LLAGCSERDLMAAAANAADVAKLGQIAVAGPQISDVLIFSHNTILQGASGALIDVFSSVEAGYEKMRDKSLHQIEKTGHCMECFLWKADLKEAQLRNINLGNAFMNEADLSKADLRSANLRGARLLNANLSSANLRGADLTGALTLRANFNAADFHEAKIDFELYQRLKGSSARGLETAIIQNP
jgi:uncharacterized protein YjbI with pentapeptide repeats